MLLPVKPHTFGFSQKSRNGRLSYLLLLDTTFPGHLSWSCGRILSVVAAHSLERSSVGWLLALMALANRSFLLKRTLLDSTKNRGTGDSPTRCFWTQLFWISCIDPEVGFYPLSMLILLEEHQLVDFLHWWHQEISPSCRTGRFWIQLIVQQ